jgi:hypothetical protein
MNFKLRSNYQPRGDQPAAMIPCARPFDRIARVAAPLSFLLMAIPAGAGENRISFVPHLQPGQVLHYSLRLRETKTVRARSRVSILKAPNWASFDARAELNVEVLSVSPSTDGPTIQLRTTFYTSSSNTRVQAPNTQEASPESQELTKENSTVLVTVYPDGSLRNTQGLDKMLTEQQRLWREWANKFALYTQIPKQGVKRGEGWFSQEALSAPAEIRGLVWDRKAVYLGNRPCRGVSLTLKGEVRTSSQPPESCGVFTLHAILKQGSTGKDATPEDFLIRHLKTSGTAQGKSEIRAYMSEKTGCLMSARDEAERHMQVLIGPDDGSNQVQYKIAVQTLTEVNLVWENPVNDGAGDAGE